MLIFTVLKGKVVPDTTLLMSPEFKEILDYGVEKKKEELANNLLLYIFYCCDLTNANPIAKVDYRKKEENAMRMAFGKSHKFTLKESKLVNNGIDAYNFYNETALERATLIYDAKIDEMSSLLEDMKPESHAVYETHLCANCTEAMNVIEKYVANDKIIANFMKQLSDASTYKLKAMETAKKIENTGRVRGNKGSSAIERGVFRDKAKNANG
jgi:hypothetical protein